MRFKPRSKQPRRFIVEHKSTRTISIVTASTVEEAYRIFSPGNRIPFNSVKITIEFR